MTPPVPVTNIGLPSLFLAGPAIGGFLFGIFMHYTAGCGAGIFYKIGEKNSGAAIAITGFVGGVYLAKKRIFKTHKGSRTKLGVI